MSSKFTTRRIVPIAILALVISGLFALQTITVRQLVSPTNSLRDPVTLADIRGPAPEKPQADWPAIQQVKVFHNAPSRYGVSVRPPRAPPDRDSLRFHGYTRHELNHGERLRLSSGEIYLDQVAVGIETEAHESGESTFVPVEPVVYNSNLEPKTEEPPELFPRFHRVEYLNSRGTLPTARFEIKFPGIQDFKFFQAQMIDAKTGASLMYGGQEYLKNETLKIETSFLAWTARPFDLILDFAHEASEPAQHELTPGLLIETPTADLRFATLRPGKLKGQSYGTNINHFEESFSYELSPSNPGDNAAAVFFGFPSTRFIAASFAFLDANRNPLESLDDPFTHTLTSLRGYPIYAPIDAIKYLEARPLQHARRIIFHFPGLPGLPEATAKSKENFFETRIPYMRIPNHGSLGDALTGLTQLRLIGTFPPGPQTTYPLYLTNATPKDLLKLYESGLSWNENLYIDPKTRTIDARPGFWRRIRRRLTALFE